MSGRLRKLSVQRVNEIRGSYMQAERDITNMHSKIQDAFGQGHGDDVPESVHHVLCGAMWALGWTLDTRSRSLSEMISEMYRPADPRWKKILDKKDAA